MKMIVVILVFIMMQNNFKILPTKQLEEYLNANSINISEFDTCLNTNNCYVYYLKSGEAILLPNNSVSSSKGILFKDKSDLVECIKNDYFPIENENESVLEKYNSDIKLIDQGINKSIAALGSKQNNNSSVYELLQASKLNKRKLSEKELFYSALLLGEYIRDVNKGKWILLKQYGTFNPYYVPAIIYADNSIVLFWDYLNSYFIDSNTTPEIFANLPHIKKPGLYLNNAFFKNNFHGYFIK